MRSFFLILSLYLFLPSSVSALIEKDFYDAEGNLIEALLPPHFDYGNKDCHEHGGIESSYLLKGRKSEHKEIYDCAYWGILSAFSPYDDYIISPPYYWKLPSPKEVWSRSSCEWVHYFASRFSPNFESKGYGEKYAASYSEYVERYEFLHYWFNFCFDLEKHKLQCSILEIQKKMDHPDETISCCEEECFYEDIKKLNQLETARKIANQRLDKNFEEVRALLLDLYNRCAELHLHPYTYYERGKIFFDQGSIAEFISDAANLLNKKNINHPFLKFELGKAYNEINQYDLAIRILSEVIKNDPKNREAYLERAYSYFETHQFDLALKDYLKSGIHPTPIDHKITNFSKYLEFQIGALSGACQGTKEGVIQFVPSFLSSIRGLGVGLWSLIVNPLGISKEMADSSYALFTYLHENISKETLQQIIPELKYSLEKWSALEEKEQGYCVGHTISKLGVDSLLWMGSVKAIKLGRELKKANAIWTLEQAALSPVRKKEILQASARYFEAREAFRKQCKLHIGQQEKHIPGKNNFIPDRSELTISLEKLEVLASKKLGTGVPTRSTFGEAQYRELVDFGEEIGIHLSDPKKGAVIRTKTSVGEIHYRLDGEYHVVPVHPDKLNILRK